MNLLSRAPAVSDRSPSDPIVSDPATTAQRAHEVSKREPEHVRSAVRARAFWVVATTYASLVIGVPFTAAAEVHAALADVVGSALATGVAAIVAVLLFALVPGVLSLPHQRWIVPGRMPTDVGVRAYFHRRLYGLCWTSLYYNQFVYWLVLSLPWSKIAVLRLFGYRGAARFTVYPDTWIRDLPLLDIGEGAYLSNKATIGTNMITREGEIIVDRITVGPRALVGHLAAIGPGTRLEAGSEAGVGALIGLRAKLDRGATLAHGTILDHGARMGANTKMRPGAYVGSASSVAADLVLPAMSVVGDRERVRNAGGDDATRRQA